MTDLNALKSGGGLPQGENPLGEPREPFTAVLGGSDEGLADWEARVAQYEAVWGRMQEDVLERVLLAAGFSNQDLSCTFENYDPTFGGNEEALRICKRYAEAFRPGCGVGLLLTGPVGVGKSHLAAATVREIVRRDRGVAVRKFKLPALIARGRTMFDDENGFSALEEELRALALVWIDELTTDVIANGTYERTRAFETLYRVIDTLVEAKAGLLVTTNSPVEKLMRELRALEGAQEQSRIVDRLRLALHPVRLQGPSYRAVLREKRLKELFGGER